MPATRLEKFWWWCDRWLWWTVNGWFADKASDLMKDAAIAKVPDFSVTWRVQERKGYTVEPSSPRVLLIKDKRQPEDE